MEMAERIKERRLALGYTQEELGEKLGLQKSAIAKYENGRVENIKRSVISKMAEILECSPTYLMGWDPPSQNDAEIFADILGDRRLMEYSMKLKNMNESDKEKIYSYIDFLVCQKETGG